MFSVSENESYIVIGDFVLVVAHMEIAGSASVNGLLAGLDAVDGYCPGEVAMALGVQDSSLLAHSGLPVLEHFHHQGCMDFLTELCLVFVVRVLTSGLFLTH